MPLHIDGAHSYWDSILSPNDCVIDATCGNGHDALFLASRCRRLLCMDIQLEAIEATKKRLQRYGHVDYFHQSHEIFPTIKDDVTLIVYNLGYLPGGDKSITTLSESTLRSIAAAVDLSKVVSIMCYPGHDEGAREANALLQMVQNLDRELFEVKRHVWSKKERAPFLLIIKKKI